MKLLLNKQIANHPNFSEAFVHLDNLVAKCCHKLFHLLQTFLRLKLKKKISTYIHLFS